MRLRPLLTAAWAVSLACVASAARADDTAELEGLLNETVVTTASKSAETSATAPATSTTLTAEDIRRYGIHSLDEAIDFLSLGVVTSNPLHSVDIGARGVLLSRDDGDHFLLLINGHAVNEPLFGRASFERGLGVTMEMIDHIEVIVGPGSVLYGSDAMLGVINVITKRAKDWHGTHAIVESELGKSYRAAGGAGYELSLFGKPSEVTVAVEYFSQNGPAFTFGPQNTGIDIATGEPTRYARNGPATGIWGGLAKGTYYSQVPSALLRFVSGNLELNLHAKSYVRSTPYRSRYTSPTNDFDDTTSPEIDRQIWGDLKYRATLSSRVQLTTRLYGDSYDYRDIFSTSEASGCIFDVRTCRYQVTGVSRWAGLEEQASFDWLKDASLVTLLGVDARIRFGATKTDSRDFDTGRILAPSGGLTHRKGETLGAYVQQTWQPTRWLELNGGARLDSDERYTGVLSPRLAAAVKPWQGGALKGIYAEAFRAPTWFETDYASSVQIQSQHLVPERVRSVETSIEQRFGAQRILFGAFRSWWTNMIELHLLSTEEQFAAANAGQVSLLRAYGIAQYRNVSSIDNYGLNAAYEGSLVEGSFRYGLNVTGAYARMTDNEFGTIPIPVAPQVFGNARVSYDIPGAWPALGLAGHFLGKRVADRGYDGHFVPLPVVPPQLELRATVSGTVPFIPGLSYRASANYAFANRGPYVVGPQQDSGAPAPGLPLAQPELVPVDTFRATLGLQYDFLQ